SPSPARSTSSASPGTWWRRTASGWRAWPGPPPPSTGSPARPSTRSWCARWTAPATARRPRRPPMPAPAPARPGCARPGAAPPPPIPATGPLEAYLLASTDQSFDDLAGHYQQVSTIHPTYFEVRADGSLIGSDDPRITGFARLHGIRVEPRVESQSASVLHT